MTKQIFDNSNLAESYSGVTTPLTYSFVKYVYQEVYQHFCRMMGVGRKTINENQDMFARMVEFIGYHMYYNLLNWYKLVSFLPGYQTNARFLEKMLGVQKEHQASLPKLRNRVQAYLWDVPCMLVQIVRISASFAFMGILIRRFKKRFDEVFKEASDIPLSDLKLDELMELYLSLMHKLISHWRTPIANDFAVMVSTGLADKLLSRVSGANNIYLHLRLSNSLISLDPGLQIVKIVDTIRNDQDLYELFMRTAEPDMIWSLLKRYYSAHASSQLITEYLKRFGHRIPNELKLESETLEEKPDLLIALVKSLLAHPPQEQRTDNGHAAPNGDGLGRLGIVDRLCMRWLIGWAAKSIKRREETRFRRALIFGYARRIFLVIGRKLHAQGSLDGPRDIFYCTTEEIMESISTQRWEHLDRLLIQSRKDEFTNWKSMELPRRIETSQTISEIEKDLAAKRGDRQPVSTSIVLRGMVAVRPERRKISGVALVLTEFNPHADFRDKILVARHTDPGWTIVFPLLRGLVIERGGMLSHAAIVARELNIPCIVGVEEATRVVGDGDTIHMDLDSGEVGHDGI